MKVQLVQTYSQPLSNMSTHKNGPTAHITLHCFKLANAIGHLLKARTLGSGPGHGALRTG
jgi:hypothetical protein